MSVLQSRSQKLCLDHIDGTDDQLTIEVAPIASIQQHQFSGTPFFNLHPSRNRQFVVPRRVLEAITKILQPTLKDNPPGL
jgi:hypothetical protein